MVRAGRGEAVTPDEKTAIEAAGKQFNIAEALLDRLVARREP
jgi:hypothetical protein